MKAKLDAGLKESWSWHATL